MSNLDRKTRKRYTRYALIGGNFLLVLIVSAFILTNRSASQTVRTSTVSSVNSTASSVPNPLDQLSSAQIALTAAQQAGMQELTSVRNQADSDTLVLNVVPNDTTAVAKPQIVATSVKSNRDIRQYTTVAGDSVSALATKFSVSADSIKWSNNLSGDTLKVGLKLVIPPVNGVIYTVKSGDTPASLATKYQADANEIISYNDAEINGLKPGEQIIIPNGRVATPTYSYASSYYGLAWGSTALYGFNGYDYGNCTWYVATQISVPANWGNASTWSYGARASGWTVSPTPTVGAIAQTPYAAGGLGHVGIVIGISPDGSQVEIRDMNNYGDGGGYGRVGTGWVSVGTYPNYITH